jgi:predicted phage terminase large subunit-like protein
MNPSDPIVREASLRLLAAQEERLARWAERSLQSFVEQAWPILEPGKPYLDNWHIGYIVEHLEAITRGDLTRLLITMPPRYMKSLLVSVLWPVWEWIRYPERRWMFVSHAEALATKLAVDRRLVLRSPWFGQRYGSRVRLMTGQNEKLEFRNDRRGVMLATSIGSSVIGKGGDRIVIDDPQDPHQVDHVHARDSAREAVSHIIGTRLDDKRQGAIVVVMQRLHSQDVAALCLDHGFTPLSLPALADARTVITFPWSGRAYVREIGDPLWAAREDAEALATQRRVLGEYAFLAQFQQQPTPRGGVIFKREWWPFFDEAPECEEIWQSWDLAFKGTATSDYVVGLVVGRVGEIYYILDRFKAQVAFNDTCQAIQRMRARYPKTNTVLVEEAANGAAVVDALRGTVPGLIAVQPEGGKFARASAVLPLVEAGQVRLPNPMNEAGRLIRDRAWVDDFLATLGAFPNGEHDDDVDALSQLLARAQKRDPWWDYIRMQNAKNRPPQ